MFRRKASLGTQSRLGNKDRKRLRDQALKTFPRLTEQQIDLLLPPKEEISVAKLQLSVHSSTAPGSSGGGGGPGGGSSSSSKKNSSQSSASVLPSVLNPTGSNRGVVYFSSKAEPIFFEINGLLSPSVYALWLVPEMLPTFVIHSPVSSFILKGADLMMPGVVLPLTIRSQEKFKKEEGSGVEDLSIALQELWSIRVVGNSKPFAVGRSAVAAGSLRQLGGKGKALEVFHHYGDGLWQIGPQSSPNALFTLKEILGTEEDEEEETGATSTTSQAPSDLTSSSSCSSSCSRESPPPPASSLEHRSVAASARGERSAALGDSSATHVDAEDGWGSGSQRETNREEEEEQEEDEGHAAQRENEKKEDQAEDDRELTGRTRKEEGGGVLAAGSEEEEEEREAEEKGESDERTDRRSQEEEEEEEDNEEKKVNGGKESAKDKRKAQGRSPSKKEEASSAPSLPTQVMDEYLSLCALEILHALSDDQLPMDISALNSKISSDASAVYFEKLKVPEGKPPQFVAPDLRKSSYKKLTKFVQYLSKNKLLQTKETRGIVSLIKINRSHPKYKAYSPVPEKTKKKIQEKLSLLSSSSAMPEQDSDGLSSPTATEHHGNDGGSEGLQGLAPSAAPAGERGDRKASGGRSAGVADDGASPGKERTLAAASAASSPSSSSPSLGPVVLEFYTPPQRLLKIFQAMKVRTGKDIFFTSREMREVLTGYLKMLEETDQQEEEEEEEEKRRKASGGGGEEEGREEEKAEKERKRPSRGKEAVVLDDLLKEALLTREELQASGQNSGRGTSTRERSKKEDDEKKTQIPSKIEMKKEEVFARWQSSWQPCYAVLPPGSSSSSSSSSQQSDVLTHLKIQKGTWQPVTISVEDRAGGRKHSTQIVGLQTFLLDPKTVAEYLQKKLAAAASVCTLPGQKDAQAVSVQGSNATAVAEILVSHFHLQKKFVLIKQKKSSSSGPSTTRKA